MSQNENKFRSYIFLWAGVLLSVLISVAIINYSVDPYGMFDAPRVQGFNKFKPGATPKVRITKPYQVDAIKPQTIIAGNSRPEMGLDPANSCWPESAKPVYNLSIPGATVYMASRFIQHAIAGNDVKQVFWGLDFVDFVNHEAADSWPPPPARFEERLRVNVDGEKNGMYGLQRSKDQLGSLFSLDALKSSVQTVLGQSNTRSATVRRDGFNPASDFLDVMALEGQGLIFKQNNITVAEVFNQPGRSLFLNGKHSSLPFDALRHLLKRANKADVSVTLFINPYHSDYLARIKLAGLWDQFLLWKQELTYLVAEQGVLLWDFSGFNELSNEQPPALADKQTVLAWFWEPAHYRRQYGDMMLSQMLALSCHSSPKSAKGVLLDKEGVDALLEDFDAQMLLYFDNYPEAVMRIEAL